jgi:osmotically-inducible protein OsmY
VVQLTGVVDSAADRSKAEQVARSVGGVKSVVNNLQVK